MPIMVTVHREAGLNIVIFTQDHEPAHVHVFGDGHAKFNLIGADGLPEMVMQQGFSRGDARRAKRIITEQQAMLLQRWSDIHG
jgi:hypothetical protein